MNTTLLVAGGVTTAMATASLASQVRAARNATATAVHHPVPHCQPFGFFSFSCSIAAMIILTSFLGACSFLGSLEDPEPKQQLFNRKGIAMKIVTLFTLKSWASGALLVYLTVNRAGCMSEAALEYWVLHYGWIFVPTTTMLFINSLLLVHALCVRRYRLPHEDGKIV